MPLKPVIPTIWEAAVESLCTQEFKVNLGNIMRPSSQKKKKEYIAETVLYFCSD
jgi:hypothetical protein